jgi:crossover junction endodeoxyribonuclease RuvC
MMQGFEPRLTLGIDPGLSGALAFYDQAWDTLEVFDMPTHTIKSGTKMKRKIDLHGLAAIVGERKLLVKLGVVENVGAMPGQGVTSMFSFGFSAGCAQMALAAMSIPMQLVTPAVWKKDMKLNNNKDDARRAASRLMPKHAHHWPLVKHDGRAEAALLAYWLAAQMPKKAVGKFEDML